MMAPIPDPLHALEQWFISQCDGDWEHYVKGITIGTLDNPGWWVKVDLCGTELENQEFERTQLDRSDSDWVHCRVEDGQFQGYGGPGNLGELLEIFLTWANSVRDDG